MSGTIGAIAFPMDDITDLLYRVGAVFAPMISIQIPDFFLPEVSGEGTRGNAGLDLFSGGYYN